MIFPKEEKVIKCSHSIYDVHIFNESSVYMSAPIYFDTFNVLCYWKIESIR
jgi:hypothetical protein